MIPFKSFSVAAGALILAVALCGCMRGLGTLDDLVQRSTAIYVARHQSGRYFVIETIREPADHSAWPRVGELIESGLSMIHSPEQNGAEIVIFVHRREPRIRDLKNLGQSEIPLIDGRLAHWDASLDELRRMARGT